MFNFQKNIKEKNILKNLMFGFIVKKKIKYN